MTLIEKFNAFWDSGASLFPGQVRPKDVIHRQAKRRPREEGCTLAGYLDGWRRAVGEESRWTAGF